MTIEEEFEERAGEVLDKILKEQNAIKRADWQIPPSEELIRATLAEFIRRELANVDGEAERRVRAEMGEAEEAPEPQYQYEVIIQREISPLDAADDIRKRLNHLARLGFKPIDFREYRIILCRPGHYTSGGSDVDFQPLPR